MLFHGGKTYEDLLENRIYQMLYDLGYEWNYVIVSELEDGRFAVEIDEWEDHFDISTMKWVVYRDLVADTLEDLVALLEKRSAEDGYFYDWEKEQAEELKELNKE